MYFAQRWLLSIITAVSLALAAQPGRVGAQAQPDAARAGAVRGSSRAPAGPAGVVITGQTPGATAFISKISATVTPVTSLKSVQFAITPKPGSVTRPLSGTYSSTYLQERGYLDPLSNDIVVPVYGLYEGFTNTVTLRFLFNDNSSQSNVVMVTADSFTDPCGFSAPNVLQARTNSTNLSYDYILVKSRCSNLSPRIVDTDGELRWIGTAGISNLTCAFFDNAIYLANGQQLLRVELDGSPATVIANYSSLNVTELHHNIDPGKRGLILEADTGSYIESVLFEVDRLGSVLHVWHLANIITAAMNAGGDDPSQFVAVRPVDWFHNNAAAYRKSDDSVIISSRENFVIALDYQSDAIKWIFGDTAKKWFQFPSLSQFYIAPSLGSLAPIGQHAVSLTDDDSLLLFDNGTPSLNHTPAGNSRPYVSPRKYRLDLEGRVATEIWNFPNGESVFDPYCSSVYEDRPSNYLVDYAVIGGFQSSAKAQLLGLDPAGNKIFNYEYPTVGCDMAYNSTPLHLEDTRFTSVFPFSAVSRKTHGRKGAFDINLPLSGSPGIECRNGGVNKEFQVVVTFSPAVTVQSATVQPAAGETAAVVGSPIVNGDEVTINLTNVSNAQELLITLHGVNDGTVTDDLSIRMGVLAGDTTGNGRVNSADIGQVKSQSGAPLSTFNKRDDVTFNGAIDSADIGFVKSKSGTSIPPPSSP